MVGGFSYWLAQGTRGGNQVTMLDAFNAWPQGGDRRPNYPDQTIKSLCKVVEMSE
jgi:hypothetical protein